MSDSNGKRELETSEESSFKKQKVDSPSQLDIDQLLKSNISNVSSIEGTPEIEAIITQAEYKSALLTNKNASSLASATSTATVPAGATPVPEVVTVEDESSSSSSDESEHSISPGPDVDSLDVQRGRTFLAQRYLELEEIKLSQKLLEKKALEDAGIDGESDDEDFEDLLELFGIDPDEISLDLPENERKRLLLDSMDQEQEQRYETFRRSNLNINGIRKLVNGATSINVPNDFAKIIAGVGKLFVGQIVEKAKDVQRRDAEVKVTLQIKFKNQLKRYEELIAKRKLSGQPFDDIIKPQPPTFYDALLQQEMNSNSSIKREYNSDTFRVIIPKETHQLTPDHIREAWRLYEDEENGAINGRWRQQGAGNGMLFR
ncbi:TATA-binding protein-associated factor [Martiniozyma asiatica (nom. inval.)]|nr:TATA-binding protein-associated factor [Martiniozyma asiatica]